MRYYMKSLREAKPLFFNISPPSPFKERGDKGGEVARHLLNADFSTMV